jgi:hypothetical protein
MTWVVLQVELQKYKPRAHKPALSFDRGAGPLGGLDLRFTVNQIHALLEDLNSYRPAKGRWAWQVEMQQAAGEAGTDVGLWAGIEQNRIIG